MRGKQAAKAAKRRAEQTADQVAELRAKLDAERAAWQQERAELTNEVARLHNRLTREVNDLARTEVRRAEDAGREQLREECDRNLAKAREVLAFLRKTAKLAQPQWVELCGLLGVQFGEFYGDDARRDYRRHTNKSGRMASAVLAAGDFHLRDGVRAKRRKGDDL